MKCCYCGSELSKVVDKRSVLSSGEIRRRRECLKCHKRFTTYEKVAGVELVVQKRDGRREAYSSEKLRNGIVRSLEKRPGIDQVGLIVARIEAKLRSKADKCVPTKVIGQAVLLELKKLDKIAYLRFASVYRSFQNTSDFTKEMETLEKIHKVKPGKEDILTV